MRPDSVPDLGTLQNIYLLTYLLTYLPTYLLLSHTFFSINYNETHKSRLKYESKYDLYKISPKKKLKT